VLDAGAPERLEAALEQIADAYESRTALRRNGEGSHASHPTGSISTCLSGTRASPGAPSLA
jgi:hypothetical protein